MEAERGQLRITFGSSAKTSAGIVDALAAWWAALDETAYVAMTRLQSTRDHGPASRGLRTQLLHRLVPCADQIGPPIPRRSSPPSHSKYQPLERCWGRWELPGNGTTLVDVETRVEGAKRMTWKGIHPRVELSRTVYPKGMALGTKAMQAVESRLERHPELPKWAILLRPASAW